MSPEPTPSREFRDRVLGGEVLVGAFLMLGSPLAAELCGRAGFDWLIVDLEHGAATEAELLGQVHAIEGTPAVALVRPEVGSRIRIGRVLDLGAAGVMLPRLETADDAREVVSYLRYPPDGVRGLALLTRGARLGGVSHGEVRALNDGVVGIFQVENQRAVENAPAIAAVDGIDVLFVGPTDLTHGLGIPGRFDEPAYREAVDAVVRAARAAGKAAGILLRVPGELERHLELGFTFVGLGSDAAFIVDGGRAALAVAGTRARSAAGSRQP